MPPLLLVTLAIAAPSHPRVVVIGLDGASLNLVEAYVTAGVTPNLGALITQGASGELASYWPLRTPQVWTSIVTGKLPGQHGLWDHVSNSAYNPPPFRSQLKKQLTSKERRSRALWEILSERGLHTLSVGWISSWPAERLDRAVIAAPAMLGDDPRQSSIKGSFWRDAPGQIEPSALWPVLRGAITEPQEITTQELARFADVPPRGHLLYALPFLERYVYTLRWSLARAKTVEAATLALLSRQTPDVLLTYFQCSDSLLHRFWIFQKSVEDIRARLDGHAIPSALAPELKQRFGGVVEACYRDIDERVGRILSAARGPDTMVLIVSDHGFGEAPVPHPSRDEPYGGNHRDNGLLIAVADRKSVV
jgi:hypothetical protein